MEARELEAALDSQIDEATSSLANAQAKNAELESQLAELMGSFQIIQCSFSQ